MEIVSDIFRNKRVEFNRLIPFGFAKDGGKYVYRTALDDGRFELTVTISPAGVVTTDLADAGSGDAYILHGVPEATGPFVGKIRKEFEEVLASIAEACFESGVFKSGLARQIIAHVREKYHDQPEFLWTKFPYNAVLRRKDNEKWYAALLVLKRSKLGFDSDEEVEIIDLRAKPDELERLVRTGKYLPGYHMNKKHWVTICLDGSVPADEIFRRIDESFALAVE